MRIELHPEAREEVRAAALWYDQRQGGLGDDFVAEITSALERVSEQPTAFPSWPQLASRIPIRRATLSRFPYVLAFETHPDHVLILAVAHAKRRPLYWLRRIQRGPA